MTVDAGDVRPAMLAEAFLGGAAAVTVAFGDRLGRLWRRLVADEREQLPWQAPLIDIARNHCGSESLVKSLGDVAYFQPGQHGYIARKIEIDRDDAGTLKPEPARFFQGDREYAVPMPALSECCAIVDLIMDGLRPRDRAPGTSRVVLQRLKYQAGAAELERLEALTRNAMARWGRVGFRIDAHRGRVNPRLNRKGLSDAMAIMMLNPRLRRLAEWGNRTFGDPRLAPPSGGGRRIVEAAHLDDRFFSAICGSRDTIATQVYHAGAWHTLPIGLDRLTIIPGKTAQRAFGLTPALHRVIYSGDAAEGEVDPRTGNVTMLLGAA
ncbi:hypothetical protein [Stakelama saccharophila]|uniref:Uncharacterized protein n=1 Tax=Stakelama saccharophila TaxID=3075605 RepID=A0ABZ0BAD4_9SPHN|nr:hypothetical protein [Stakelama sp. W311]WNO54222.1 hypothetical protein RPR59_02880 [Stakelama sp. W311]